MSLMPVRMVVIGAGYLGRFHAQKLSRLTGAELVGVVDSNPDRAAKVSREVGAPAFSAYQEILDKIDAACVVTPTVTHAQVARELLAEGKDVFCEKPLTADLKDADVLVELAQAKGLILQVGHLERFNPAVEEMFKRVTRPVFVECNRIAPYKARATDVDVVSDLMIHDLDIITSLVGCEPSEVRAVGVPVLGAHADIVNARLEFPTGCVANITASRLALKEERKMRVFQPDCYVALDFAKRRLTVVDSVEYVPGRRPKVKVERPRFGKIDPLEEELKDFLECVRTRRPPRVSGEEGRRALSCALAVRARAEEGQDKLKSMVASARSWVGACAPGEADDG